MKGLISIVLVALLGASFIASAGSVQLMAKSNGATNPSIVGTTNLPDGTMLSTSITCPLMYPHCKEFWSGESKAVVHDGIFVSEPISLKYAPAPLDQYVITVVALAKQSPVVTSNLEAIGWNGSSIIAFHFNVGPDKNSPEMRARVEALEKDSERKGICGQECQQTIAESDTPKITPDQAKRAYEAMDAAVHDPVKIKLMECIGVKVYEDPQPEGHPPSERDCRRFLRSQGANPDDYSPLKD